MAEAYAAEVSPEVAALESELEALGVEPGRSRRSRDRAGRGGDEELSSEALEAKAQEAVEHLQDAIAAAKEKALQRQADIGAATQHGVDNFRERLEAHCVAKLVTSSLKRHAKAEVEEHAGDAAGEMAQNLEYDADNSIDAAAPGSATEAYLENHLDAIKGGYKANTLDRTFEKALTERVLERAALDLSGSTIDGIATRQELRDRVQDGAATAYKRSEAYLEGGGSDALSASLLAAGAAALYNPALAPIAGVYAGLVALVDGLLGDPVQAAERAAEREAREYMIRKAKGEIRTNPNFKRDGAFPQAMVGAVSDLAQDADLQQEVFNEVTIDVASQSIPDGLTKLADSWITDILIPGEDGDTPAFSPDGRLTETDLMSKIMVKGTVNIPVPIFGSDATYLAFELSSAISQEDGLVGLEMDVAGGVGAAFKSGDKLKAKIELMLTAGLNATGADLRSCANNISYAFYRAALKSADGIAEDDADRATLKDNVVGKLWGFGGDSGKSGMDEAAIWAAMVEEQMADQEGSVGFSAGAELRASANFNPFDDGSGGGKEKEGYKDSVQLGHLGYANADDVTKAFGDDAFEVLGKAGVSYAGELATNDNGETVYTDKMQEYVFLKGAIGPVSAWLKFSFDQPIERNDTHTDPAAPTKSGSFEYGVTLDIPNNKAADLAPLLAQPGLMVLPLAGLFDSWTEAHKSAGGTLDAKTTSEFQTLKDASEHGDPSGDLSKCTDDAVQQFYIESGLDGPVENVASALADMGDLQIVISGSKVIFGSPDGSIYGKGWDNTMVIQTLFDAQIGREQNTDNPNAGGAKLVVKAWDEKFEAVLSEQEALSPGDVATS